MPRSAPERTCVGCRKTRPKHDLLRIVRTPEGPLALDPDGKSEGRGVYVCRDAACLEVALRRKALERGLKAAVPTGIIEQAREQLGERR